MRLAPLLCFVTLLACGSDAESPPSDDDPPPPQTCAVGTIALDAGAPEGVNCLEPGLPPDACADGFQHDGDHGCAPILPASACAFGTMAVPGETACREVMPCGSGRWGDIPIDAGTQFVDQAHTGASDGSEQQPWLTIQAAIDAATPGGLVAIASGDYVEDVLINTGVRVMGRCPAMVSLRDASSPIATLTIRSGADGSTVSGLSVSGSTRAVGVTGSIDVLFDRLHIHDTTNTALLVQDVDGSTAATLRDSLIEQVGGAAALIEGSPLTIERSVIRDVIANANGVGRGPNVQAAGELHMRDSLIERCVAVTVHVSGASAFIERSVLIDNAGRAINAQDDDTSMTGSVVEVADSYLARNEGVTVFASDSTLTLRNTVVRDALADPVLPFDGYAIAAQHNGGTIPTVDVQSCLIERFIDAGIAISGGTLTIGGTLVRDAVTGKNILGRGINVQVNLGTGAAASATISDTEVASAVEFGVLLNGASATLTNVLIRETRPGPDGAFGDGIVASNTSVAPASVDCTTTNIHTNARAGLALFGATAQLSSAQFDCNTININGENTDESPFSLNDLGGNRCGCGAEFAACKALSAGLSPPSPLPLAQ